MNYSIASDVITMTHKYDSLASHIGEDGGDMLVNSSRTLKIFSILSFLLEPSMTSAQPRHLDLRGRPIESSHDLLAKLSSEI